METKKLPLEQILFTKSWKIYKEKVVTLIAINIVPTLFLILGGIIFGLLVSGTFILASQLSLTTALLTGGFSLFLGILFTLCLVVVFTWAEIATIFAIKEKVSIGTAYKKALPLFIPFLWVNILTGLVISSGFVLLIIPGIILSIWLSLASYICVLEKERGLNALLKSMSYLKGIAWRVFWYYFFLGIVAMILSLITSLFNKTIPFFDTLAWLIIGPLFSIYTYLIYDAVKTYKGDITLPTKDTRKGWLIFLACLAVLFGLCFFFGFLPWVFTGLEQVDINDFSL